VLFDADGTLLDTLDDLADSMNGTLVHFGFPIHDREKYKYFVGEGMENLVRRALPDSARKDPELVSRCSHMMRETYDRNWNNRRWNKNRCRHKLLYRKRSKRKRSIRPWIWRRKQCGLQIWRL
jgi:phosphoglycolate phosphatase-like HAD superfamily hydrolase